jgi:C4-dicarboxylate transporter, DctQ subunit
VRGLCRVDEFLGNLEKVLVIAVLSGMVLLAFLQVLLRNLWGSGLPWVDILLRHVVLWLGIVGASLATKMKRHIRIDLLPRQLPPRTQQIVERGILRFAAGVSTLLSLGAIELVRQERVAGSIAFGSVPTWVLQLILPIGFAILAFRFVVQAVVNGSISPNTGA